ncbi:MAG: hypothetical protein HC831_22140 [Chloroflexia bacterium]|nr:hypothetical protein [Chloroflexia bacterium]
MELIYKSNDVDILFDPNKNILVQKWKDKVNIEEIDMDNLSYTLDEMIKIQLYESPDRDIEEELKIMLFQSYPHFHAKA